MPPPRVQLQRGGAAPRCRAAEADVRLGGDPGLGRSVHGVLFEPGGLEQPRPQALRTAGGADCARSGGECGGKNNKG